MKLRYVFTFCVNKRESAFYFKTCTVHEIFTSSLIKSMKLQFIRA
jgi:hypothetical protein